MEPVTHLCQLVIKLEYKQSIMALLFLNCPIGSAVSMLDGKFSNPKSSGCQHSDWVNDGYCDDGNNNVDCNFDGGDCCNNNAPNWDHFCTICECLESQTSEYHTLFRSYKPQASSVLQKFF